MSYNIIDIEASGLDIESYPIEIAILIAGRVHSWLVKPETKWQYWYTAAEAIHGISRQQLIQQGLTATQVASEINALVKETNGLLYSDAAQWDADWMNVLYLAVDSIQEFHIVPIQDLFSNDEEEIFKRKRSEIGNTNKYRLHRAGQDVQLIFEAMMAVFDET